jgi:hypothetical protein
MAETIATKSATAGIDISTAVVNQLLTGLIAGEDIALCDLVYLKSDGKVWRATAAAANAAAKAIGVAPRAAKAGQPITVVPGPNQVVRWSDAALGTPGTLLFVGETAGTLSSIATTGDAVGFAQVIDASNIRLIRAY